jgi:hypothetical protein
VPIYHNRPTFAFLCVPPSPTSRLVLPRSRAKVPCVCGGGGGLLAVFIYCMGSWFGGCQQDGGGEVARK